MTKAERKELEREVRRLYFAHHNKEAFYDDYGKAYRLLSECIEKAGSPFLEKLLEVRKLLDNSFRHACDAFSDLMDDDVARAFIKASQDSPQDRRIHFAAREMERIRE